MKPNEENTSNEEKSSSSFGKDFSKPVLDISSLDFAFDDQIFEDFHKKTDKNSFSLFQDQQETDVRKIIDFQKSSLNPFSFNFFGENEGNDSSPVPPIVEPDSDESSSDSSDSDEIEKNKIMMEISFNESMTINGIRGTENLSINEEDSLTIHDEECMFSCENQMSRETKIEKQKFEIFDLEPRFIEERDSECDEIYDEGHLTSTSDLDLIGVPDEILPQTPKSSKREIKPDKSPSQRHAKIQASPLILPSPVPQKASLLPPPVMIQEFQTPTSFHGLRRPGLFQGGFKKGPMKSRMTDEEIADALAPTKHKQIPKANSQPEGPPQKPLTNCCVAAAMNGNFRPLYTEYGNKERAKIHWMSFPGFNLSPFENPPTNIDDYLMKQKKKKEAGPNAVENEAIAINYCEICKSKFTDAVSHRASELHQQRAALCNWSDIENLFKDLNAKFVKELDS